MKTFYEWYKEVELKRDTDSLSAMLILCKEAWFEGQRQLCLNYDFVEKSLNKEIVMDIDFSCSLNHFKLYREGYNSCPECEMKI